MKFFSAVPHIMEMGNWIRHRAATGQALNLHEVARERPDLLEEAFASPSPRGWRRSLIDAGVDPYKIVHIHTDVVACMICGYSGSVLGTHLKRCHETTTEEYRAEHGAHCEVSSESYRAGKFTARPLEGIAHWEQLWSKYYIIDWIIRLREAGHDLNYQSIQVIWQSLTICGSNFFGTWDNALCAAGFDPVEERHRAPGKNWDEEMFFERLRAFAEQRCNNPRLVMPNDLRSTVTRLFGTLDAAAKAAGLETEDVSMRALFHGEKVNKLIEEIRKLENLKGRERRARLAAIYHGSSDNKRIIQSHFLSLKQLAEKSGIDPRVVAPKAYRDEADVHHDLDMIEREGGFVCFETLRRGYKRLYNVISETGWGSERLRRSPGSQPFIP